MALRSVPTQAVQSVGGGVLAVARRWASVGPLHAPNKSSAAARPDAAARRRSRAGRVIVSVIESGAPERLREQEIWKLRSSPDRRCAMEAEAVSGYKFSPCCL
jgi:hypothetical protein